MTGPIPVLSCTLCGEPVHRCLRCTWLGWKHMRTGLHRCGLPGYWRWALPGRRRAAA